MNIWIYNIYNIYICIYIYMHICIYSIQNIGGWGERVRQHPQPWNRFGSVACMSRGFLSYVRSERNLFSSHRLFSLLSLLDLKFACDFRFSVQICFFSPGSYLVAWEAFFHLVSFLWDLLKNVLKDNSPTKCAWEEFFKGVLKESSWREFSNRVL